MGPFVLVYRSLAQAARGKYLIASDSDDVAMPRRLETLVKLAEHHPDTSLVYGTVHLVSQDIATCFTRLRDTILSFLLVPRPISSLMAALSFARRPMMPWAGMISQVKWAEGCELRLRLATFGPMISTDELVYLYRSHSESWTARNGRLRKKRDVQTIVRGEKTIVQRIRTRQHHVLP